MKKGITAGTFDLLHSGHILMLKECKSYCDYLTVCLQNDPTVDRNNKNKPIQSIVERQIQLLACKYVDEIVVYNTEEDLYDILTSYDYDFRILGEDWRGKPFTGHDIPEHLNKVIFNSRKHRWSSSNLRNRIKGEKK